MNFAPLLLALAIVVLYIIGIKIFGPPPTAQTGTMLNVVVGLIVLALIVAAFWPLVAQVSK